MVRVRVRVNTNECSINKTRETRQCVETSRHVHEVLFFKEKSKAFAT